VIGLDIVAHTSSHIRTKPKAACPQQRASLFVFDCMGIFVRFTYARYQQRPDHHLCVRRVHEYAHTVEHTERDALCWGQADGCVKGVSRWACTALGSRPQSAFIAQVGLPSAPPSTSKHTCLRPQRPRLAPASTPHSRTPALQLQAHCRHNAGTL